jgi:hypothetical protein
MAAETNGDHGTRRVEEFVRLLKYVRQARGESDDRAFGASPDDERSEAYA